MIGVLNVKNVCTSENHRKIFEVCGEGAVNKGNVRIWCRLFKEGRTNVYDMKRNGRPCLFTCDLKEKVNAKIWE